MIKERLIKIWKDPVWSKIISVVIIALTTLVFNFFQAGYSKITFSAAFRRFWTQKIDIWICAGVVLCFSVFYLILKKKIRNILFRYTPETLELDRILFNRIRTELLPTDKMAWISANGFSSNPFEDWRVHIFYEISEESRKADFYFVNPKLERIKLNLIYEMGKLDQVLISNIFGAGKGWLGIPSEWPYEKFHKAKGEIKPFEDSVGESYKQLIRIGRYLLQV